MLTVLILAIFREPLMLYLMHAEWGCMQNGVAYCIISELTVVNLFVELSPDWDSDGWKRRGNSI